MPCMSIQLANINNDQHFINTDTTEREPIQNIIIDQECLYIVIQSHPSTCTLHTFTQTPNTRGMRLTAAAIGTLVNETIRSIHGNKYSHFRSLYPSRQAVCDVIHQERPPPTNFIRYKLYSILIDYNNCTTPVMAALVVLLHCITTGIPKQSVANSNLGLVKSRHSEPQKWYDN